MENSVNLIHSHSLIRTNHDRRMFVKTDGTWIEQKNDMYKSEFDIPTSTDGYDGDYFAKLIRRYNNIIFSEDFTKDEWTKTNVTVTPNSSLKFPSNSCTKVSGFTTNAEHSLSYDYQNLAGENNTFSIYAKAGELSRIIVSLNDFDLSRGVRLKVNLTDGSKTQETYGSMSNVSDIQTSCELIDSKTTVYRIAVSAKIVGAAAVRCKITFTDNSFNESFTAPVSEGVYINAAQLSPSKTVEPYLYSNGVRANTLALEQMYKKSGTDWQTVDKKLVYSPSYPPSNDLGNDGDIAVSEPILTIGPAVRFGDGSNVTNAQRPVGFMYYNVEDESWYVKTRKSDKQFYVGDDYHIGGVSFVGADYVVIRYIWTDGKDLDTDTRIMNSSDETINNLATGYHDGQYGGHSHVPTDASSYEDSILWWTGDNMGTGEENILINIKKLKEYQDTFPPYMDRYPPVTSLLRIKLEATWYSEVGIEPVKAVINAYKGGTMVTDGFVYHNEGGEQLQLTDSQGNQSQEVAVTVGNVPTVKHQYAEVANFFYDKTTDRAYLLAPSEREPYAGQEGYGDVDPEKLYRYLHSDCRLVPSSEKFNPKPMIRAILLNQQTYQTYNRYGIKCMRHGFNPGGSMSFWSRNYGKKPY